MLKMDYPAEFDRRRQPRMQRHLVRKLQLIAGPWIGADPAYLGRL